MTEKAAVKGRSARDLQSYSMQLQRSVVVVGLESLMAVQHAMKFLHYVLYVYCVFLIKCPRWFCSVLALHWSPSGAPLPPFPLARESLIITISN